MKIFTTLNPNNNQNQIDAINSWSNYQVYSINTKEEIKTLKKIYPQIQFIPTTKVTNIKGKKLVKLNSILDEIEKIDSPSIIINSDIIIKDGFELKIENKLLKNSIILGCRYEVDKSKVYKFPFGYDFVIINPKHANLLKNEKYTIGLPWWDYWVPVAAMKNGLNVYEIKDEFLYHKTHQTNYQMEIWENLAKEFYNEVIVEMTNSGEDLTINDFLSYGKEKMDIKRFIESKSINISLCQQIEDK